MPSAAARSPSEQSVDPEQTVAPPALSGDGPGLPIARLLSTLSEAPGLPTLVARLVPGLAPLLAFDEVALAMQAAGQPAWVLVQPRQEGVLSAGAEEPAWRELSEQGSPLLSALTQGEPVLRREGAGPFALCLPLRGGGGARGAVGVFSATHRFTHEDSEILTAVAAMAESIAQRLVLAEALARTERQARQAGGLLDELVESLASEVHSPLAVLDNGLEFLRTSLLPAGSSQAGDQVDELRLVAGTLGVMVDNLIELPRVDAGSLEVRPTSFAVEPVLLERARHRVLAARIAETRLLVRAEPAARATTDARLLARIIDNLLLNALRHTPRGGEIALVGVARPQALTIAVADTGSAIAPADREALAARGPWAGTERAPSRTFGLAYARAAAEYLGGTFAIETLSGAGALFRVTLPSAR